VKTCVGSEFRHFGTQESAGLGCKLEKMLRGSWTPTKVKLGVSGCPRNRAEATCWDIGGWAPAPLSGDMEWFCGVLARDQCQGRVLGAVQNDAGIHC
jgi:NAD(P)H-nitrite reductase large subunit